MKYILLLILFFSCRKAVEPKEPDRTETPKVDSVAMIKEGVHWYIIIQARFRTDHHRVVRLTVFYSSLEVIHMAKIPAGETKVKRLLNPVYGEPIRYEVINWDVWPYPN